MKSLFIHVAAMALMLPLLLIVNEGNLVWNFVGIVYAVWLFLFFLPSDAGKKFIRALHREILRIERIM
jgi:uncharacterized membrane protein YgaE (UPF0421/DUF939 family)